MYRTFEEPEKLPNETPVYRYLNVDQFLSFLMNRELVFQKIPNWKDQMEGVLSGFAQKILENNAIISDCRYFGSCWTLQDFYGKLFDSTNEYDAAKKELEQHGAASMWESYCSNGGVRIKSTVGKVLEQLEKTTFTNSIHGKVQYKPLTHLLHGVVQKSEYMFFYKGVSFIHETEYRFVIKAGAGSQKVEKILVADLGNFLDEILIYPTTKQEDWKSRSIFDFICQAGIVKGYDGYGNRKDGKQFCRMSCLYDKKSHELKKPNDVDQK